MTQTRKLIDWQAVELDYRAGVKTLRAIGKDHGLTHAAVRKRAARDGWTRDLSARIEAKTKELVSKLAVPKTVSKEKAATETAIVNANAELQSNAVDEHRDNSRSLRLTIVAMLDELGVLATGELREALETVLDEKLKDTDSEARKTALTKAYHAAMTLGSRAGAGRQLAAALGIAIEKERQALGIKEGSDRMQSLGEWLATLSPPGTPYVRRA